MARITEGTPGQPAEVWIQDRGASDTRLRSTLIIEDLSDVLTCISARSGANGPNNPVTQYILSQAAEYLAERLIEDAAPGSGGGSVPRTLSGALGHQPFIESVLNMSQHQMLRRWPLATDWYTDVIHYVMRPSRFTRAIDYVRSQFDDWSSRPLGEFVRLFSDAVFRLDGDPKVLRMAEALQALWPDYPPVREASEAYHEQIQTMWAPLYAESLSRYGLKLRPEVKFEELGWAFNALQTRETWERLGGSVVEPRVAFDGGRWSVTALTSLMVLSGSVLDVDGSQLSPAQLAVRKPVAR
ncbi:hypothetical protein [Propioniciclava tarda]|uniref:Uncharacterized protein n=1 Tax=Propioniciclava tarda TaxID=433330 RepID=A0A4Q9KM09_PROTD|nr:hypothetical protein [Propioniciclava tarda]TBT95523.1 hypothetical protein ET996_05360 [Propioniciclava tarda]SMO50596.1 hypothetical protein SAMN06266982_104132 [Propioniciclava tarda]HOA89847.1 hypothetical protein [Propioniciclava tarda]HQA30378.1 hypothetical protein [Propioniciclava tarda]HQD60882.1 hypothetical protein [Propioniciclava tarda]